MVLQWLRYEEFKQLYHAGWHFNQHLVTSFAPTSDLFNGGETHEREDPTIEQASTRKGRGSNLVVPIWPHIVQQSLDHYAATHLIVKDGLPSPTPRRLGLCNGSQVITRWLWYSWISVTGGRGAVVKAACLKSRRSRVRPPFWHSISKKQKVSSQHTRKTQYCGKPSWPGGSVLGLRPTGLEFRILCLEGSVISPSSYRFSWPSLAYMCTKVA